VKVILFGRKITPNFTPIVSNTGWLLADRALRMTVGFVLGVWIARYLGVAQYGLFSYATAFVYLFNPIVTLGLDGLMVRDIVQDSAAKDKTLGTVFWLRFMGGWIALLLAIITIFIFRPNEPLTISLVAILSVAGIFQAMDVIDLWFQSQVQSKYAVFARNTAFFCVALIKVILIVLHAPLIAFAWSGFAEISLGSIALAGIYQLRGNSLKAWRWNIQLAKILIREGFPLMLSSITIMMYMKIDQIMLGGMVGNQAVGIYTAATRISEAWYFIPGAFISSVAPSIYQAKERSETEYYQCIGRLLRLMNGIAFAVAIPATFLGPAIIRLCYGEVYLQSSTVLIVHIWAAVFVFMGVVTLPCFIADGLGQLSLRRTILGATINVLLNLLLIPHYTVVGAAIATVISQAVASYFSLAFHPKTRKLFQVQTRSLLLFKSDI
jgi:polysaccharide transporter, PST family